MDSNTGHETRRHSRTALNFWVDLLTAIAFAAMVGTGILAKWILPPGSRGGVGLTWLGQGRHFWGDVHFWLAIALLALIIIHVWLHWGWILGIWARLVGRLGSPVTWALILLLAALMFLPLLIPAKYSQAYKEEHDRQEELSEQQAEARHGAGREAGAGAGSGQGADQDTAGADEDTEDAPRTPNPGLTVNPDDINF